VRTCAGVGLGSSRFLAEFRSAAPAGPGGEACGCGARGGKKDDPKAEMVSSAGDHSCALARVACCCGALANHRAQGGCVAGRTAPPRLLRAPQQAAGAVWGDLALRRFGTLARIISWRSFFWCPAKLRSPLSDQRISADQRISGGWCSHGGAEARRKQRDEPTTRHKGNWRVPCSCLCVKHPRLPTGALHYPGHPSCAGAQICPWQTS
jgi:hypothetical protein